MTLLNRFGAHQGWRETTVDPDASGRHAVDSPYATEHTFDFICDRCKATLEGSDILDGDDLQATCGYYRTAPPSRWAEFANPGEARVCDACMFAEPRYRAVYGKRS